MTKNMWTKMPDETDEQFIYRICAQKDSSNMSWPKIAKIINSELNRHSDESTYRKKWGTFKRKTVVTPVEESVCCKDDCLDRIRRQTDEMLKVKKQVQDQRREYKKLIDSDARFEHLCEEIVSAANKLNAEKPLLDTEGFYCHMDGERHDAVLFLSDWHYGMTTDNLWNKYNVEICKYRLGQLLAKVKAYCKLHSVHRLYIACLGDLFHGALKASIRVASEENTCEQLMHVSELLAEFINDVSGAVNEIYFYSTYGNHARTVQDKNDSIHSDNMERIVPWWIKERLSNNLKVRVIDSALYEFIYFEVLGHGIVAVHGDLERFDKLGTDMHMLFNKRCGANIEYVFSGDKHHMESNDTFGVENAMVSSLCGTDEYANSKRLYSKPGQTLCIFNNEDGKVCTYNITF